MVRRGGRTLLALLCLLLAGCNGQPGPAPADGGPAPVVSPGPHRTDPLGLVGVWTLTGVAERDAGRVLWFAPYEVRIFGTRCAPLSGGWRADPDGLFVAEISGASGHDGESCWAASMSTPDWLRRATGYRIEGNSPVLLDASGRITARLIPGARLPAGTEVTPGEPSGIPDEVRPSFAPAAPLPPARVPADRDTLVGRWVPVRGNRLAYVELATDGAWRGSDGCNSEGGRWVSGTAGALLVTTRPVTLMACDNVPVDYWLWAARRAAFDGDVLVLLDGQGTETGRLRRAPR
ncbi:META domain-containing protein [Micromonospora echinofusca]|uniref:META domain-containing protein n=1 Tax=Micromonospora echinofusca TaxID=47858 RepID=A0ABS3VPN7_MICEH|nr:hypothetical protein [Micromonospora echinofusca]MBO4206475.1 hypothetical protein [Micromonospora echinofusca]